MATPPLSPRNNGETQLVGCPPVSGKSFTRTPLSSASPAGETQLVGPLPSAAKGFTRTPLSSASPAGETQLVGPLPSVAKGFTRTPLSSASPAGETQLVGPLPSAAKGFTRTPLSSVDSKAETQLVGPLPSAAKGFTRTALTKEEIVFPQPPPLPEEEPALPQPPPLPVEETALPQPPPLPPTGEDAPVEPRKASAPATDTHLVVPDARVVAWLVITEGEAQGHCTEIHAGENYISQSPTGELMNQPRPGEECQMVLRADPPYYFAAPAGKEHLNSAWAAEVKHGSYLFLNEETLLRLVLLCDDTFSWESRNA